MKKLAIGCGGVVLLLVIAMGGVLFWLIRELPNLDATLTHPSVVQLDQEWELVVTATNPHATEVTLDSIDIQDEFLEGFRVVSVEPASDDVMQIFGMRSWAFGLPVSPGASVEIVYTMKAVQEGHYSGEVDVCNPNQDFDTVIADVTVRDDAQAD